MRCKMRIFSFLLVGILLTSCGYSEQLQIKYDLHHGSRWNSRRDRIAFIASSRGYRKPAGLNRFPDGGIPEYLREDVSLYLFAPKKLTLKKLSSFNDLAEIAGSYRSSWKTKLVFTEGNIYFHVRPVMDWKWHKKQAKSSAEIARIKKLEEKYEKFYLYNSNKKTINMVNESVFQQKYSTQSDSKKISLTELNKMLVDVPLAKWGLIVQDIYPKPRRDYINSIIYARNTNRLTRRAILEQIVSELPPENIKDILTRMNSYKNKLNGYEKEKYVKQTFEIREKLESLLASKNKTVNS